MTFSNPVLTRVQKDMLEHSASRKCYEIFIGHFKGCFIFFHMKALCLLQLIFSRACKKVFAGSKFFFSNVIFCNAQNNLQCVNC